MLWLIVLADNGQLIPTQRLAALFHFHFQALSTPSSNEGINQLFLSFLKFFPKLNKTQRNRKIFCVHGL